MLTRYLYDCDEVCYALIDSLYKGRSKEAVFWARELVLSREEGILDKTVVKAWLLFLGVKHINWLDAWFASRSLSLIAEFSGLIKKGRSSCCLKTFVMAARGFSLEQDQEKVEASIDANDPFSFYWWSGFEKAPTALFDYVKEFVEDPSLFASLEKAMGLFPVLSMKTLISAAAVQLLCMKSYKDIYVVTENAATVELYDGLIKNRIYAIKLSMLPCRHVRVTQWDALCKSQREIIEGAGSRFWVEQGARITDDESLEAVTEELFPEDCPDEWSIANRAFSHPDKFVKYKIHIKPSYRCKLLWSFSPALRNSWSMRMELLFKACSAPEN